MYKLMMVADRKEERVIRTMLTQKNAPDNIDNNMNYTKCQVSFCLLVF